MQNPETLKPELQYQHAKNLMLKKNSNVTQIKILQWNARGLYRSRLEEFKNNLRVNNPILSFLARLIGAINTMSNFQPTNLFL